MAPSWVSASGKDKGEIYGVIAKLVFQNDSVYSSLYAANPIKFHDSVAYCITCLWNKFHDVRDGFEATGAGIMPIDSETSENLHYQAANEQNENAMVKTDYYMHRLYVCPNFKMSICRVTMPDIVTTTSSPNQSLWIQKQCEAGHSSMYSSQMWRKMEASNNNMIPNNDTILSDGQATKRHKAHQSHSGRHHNTSAVVM
ncbi:uncharacterized protein EDB93DRAFT_1101921 [Suillus bovinus]|uniref:uncharacterized protein n=1 Tax=Suillus bovinus TaxID=48563 RepID=UPI001B86CA54|nr:uncharacterized protein EDB93DRAFT_1101921 [Suillus bovinus]KAG2155363.1 hypothetical protein EDB93DRAFT_1101921 [Suillus bovinus]